MENRRSFIKKYLKLVILFIVPCLLIIAVTVAAWSLGFLGRTIKEGDKFIINPEDYEKEIDNLTPDKYEIKEFVRGLIVPWSMVFTSNDRMLVTERTGKVRVIENGKLVDQELLSLSNVGGSSSEEGLMGIAIDPDYSSNKYVYLMYSQVKSGVITNKVSRFIDQGSKLTDEKIILNDLPGNRVHDGGRIKFGPDDKLYISTGDAGQNQKAQDLNFLGGKILRINSDGTIPSDNPHPDSPVFTSGHRNPQGFDWYPIKGTMYEVEHGPSGGLGPEVRGGGDEVNIIKSGKDYGWPIVSHEKTDPRFESPKITFTPAIAPASAMFYKSGKITQFKNNFFFTSLKDEGIFRAVISNDNPEKIISYEKLSNINYGRIRDIIEGPDGSIYFSTSNRDSRGTPKEGDDKIYQIKKVE